MTADPAAPEPVHIRWNGDFATGVCAPTGAGCTGWSARDYNGTLDIPRPAGMGRATFWANWTPEGPAMERFRLQVSAGEACTERCAPGEPLFDDVVRPGACAEVALPETGNLLKLHFRPSSEALDPSGGWVATDQAFEASVVLEAVAGGETPPSRCPPTAA